MSLKKIIFALGLIIAVSAAALIFFAHGLKSVSYTHLDVYKRQE